MGQSELTERLLVHADLCRRMAARSLDESLAVKLLKMAEDCVAAAADNIASERHDALPAAAVPNWNFHFETTA